MALELEMRTTPKYFADLQTPIFAPLYKMSLLRIVRLELLSRVEWKKFFLEIEKSVVLKSRQMV